MRSSVFLAPWRHPISGEKRPIQLVGYDTGSGAMGFKGLEPLVEALKLKEGDEVILYPGDRLKDGQKVQPTVIAPAQ